ncbi:MAG: protein-L-isoaspartate O-methyltransferase [Alphaproteobacteria bacterium]|nr:protein-L-isoaspartate O-methyltransferase [Alphaproteobacteria bacterium]
MSLYAERRRYMVESQLRTNKVTNTNVLIAFEETPKESFVDEDLASLAYIDEDLMLGEARFMLEPMVFARLVQALRLNSTPSVLDIGAATGYSTAILSRLAQSVVGIECNAHLAEKGQNNLTENNVDNGVILHGALTEGLKAEAPYNAIIIEGSVENVPTQLLQQLSENGRLVAIQRDDANSPGRAVKYVRAGDGFASSTLFDAQTPMLNEFAVERSFAF